MQVNVPYKISDSPLIYLGIGTKNFDQLPEAGPEGGIYLCHTMWHFSVSSILPYIKASRILAKKNIRLVLLHNTEKERWRGAFFVRSWFCNHNIQVSEHNFQVMSQPKKYDAIYIAAAKTYKRLHLASKIKSLFIVTYFWPDVRDKDGKWDLYAFEPRVKNAEFNRDFISSAEIQAKLAASHTALALSAKEGAMFACMEYLLCGVPVVSTRSLGGRDVWLNPGNSVIVDATPEAVAQGVESLKAKAIPRETVRENALKQVWEQRRMFFDICQKESGSRSGILGDFDAFAEHVWSAPGLARLKVPD